MPDFSVSNAVVEAIIQSLVTKAVDTGWDALRKNVDVGSLILNKSRNFDLLRGFLKRLTGGDDVSELLNARNSQLQRLYTIYTNESSKLVIGNNIRVGYATQLWFIPNLSGRVDPYQLRAQEGGNYDVNSILSINNYKEIAKQFRKQQNPKQETPFQGSTVRVSAWDGGLDFVLSRSDYYDQYVTNQKEIVDVSIERILADAHTVVPPKMLKMSLRELSMQEGKMLPFQKSPLANSIGIAATVITSDGYLVLPKRNRQVHFQSGYEGCSTSGVLEWSGGFSSNFMKELVHQITNKEGPQEILLDPTSIYTHPLAFAREFERAGKPQFFFHIWTNQRLNEFVERWKVSKYPNEEFDSIRWIELYEPNTMKQPELAINQAIERILALLSTESYISLTDKNQVVLSEEARANLYYLAVFLQVERTKALPSDWIK